MCSDGLSGMIRADEIREVLLGVSDPLEACKVLTERANLAGGHDNITVIVAKFGGSGLHDPASADVVKYAKYALPDAGAAAEPSRPSAVDDVRVGPLSDEAQRESRKLKVGHTMMGMTTPELPYRDPASVEVDEPAPPEKKSTRPMTSTPPPVFSLDDEPVQIPTTGLPPSTVGFMVLAALVIVAVTGFVLLR